MIDDMSSQKARADAKRRAGSHTAQGSRQPPVLTSLLTNLLTPRLGGLLVETDPTR